MDVEEGHHAKRDVTRPETVRGGYVLDRRDEVAVAKRHELRAACRPARVQDEGDVIVGSGARGPRGVARSVALQRELAIAFHVRLDEGHSGGQCPAGRLALAWRHNEHACAGVLQVEAELLLFVCGVQRGCCPDSGGGKEKHYRLDAVGKDKGHTVASAHAQR